MATASTGTSGRPEAGEFAAYARLDIDAVEGDDAVMIFAVQQQMVVDLVSPLDEAKIRGLTYSIGKWTLKEVLGHLIDDERIYLYRSLCIARGEQKPLPGFDENAYMLHAGFENRLLKDLLQEYSAVRNSSIAFFRSMPEAVWLRRGIANDVPYTVRGLAFHIAGHELHHLRFLEDRYLSTNYS